MLRSGTAGNVCVRKAFYAPSHAARDTFDLSRLCGLAAVLILAGIASAQPPELPNDYRGVGILLGNHVRDNEQRLPAPKAALLPPSDQTISGVPPVLPMVPQRVPQTAAEVAAFVEGLSTNDATFEVLIGEGRLLTLKENIAEAGKQRPLIAVGDPSVLDFSVVGPRQIRLVGQRIGTTDLSITTSDNKTFGFEVQVIADLNVLRSQLRSMFPGAVLRLSQVRDSVIVEGEARDTGEVARIIEAIRAYLLSVQVSQARKISGQSTGALPGAVGPGRAPRGGPEGGQVPPGGPEGAPTGPPGVTPVAEPQPLSIEAKVLEPRVINLIRVPGTHQVLLKVRIAELNRTALRQIGSDFLAVDPESGAIVGSQIGGAGISGTATLVNNLTGIATGNTAPTTTLFGIFQEGDLAIFLQALRRNTILKTLAEPNLVAMDGHEANFLAGGEFPVPVPQVGASGVAPTITVQFKEFGVRLRFVPYILDGDVIRLSVDPEVSAIDFAIGTTLVAGGSVVPGLDTRKAHTTVELRQGQTLMIAGLLSLSMDGTTQRIPGLGDLPIIGTFFSNTTGQRQEKELVVMVTPYLIEPMNCDQVPATPGDEVNEPNDLERYFLGRLEGRTGRDHRSTTEYDDPFHLIHHVDLEKKYMTGPCGYSSCAPDR